MREEDLDELLPRLRQRGKDQVAANFEAAVLRKIRVRKDRVPWSFYQMVIAFLRPSWVLSAMILAGLIGVVTGAVTQEKRDKNRGAIPRTGTREQGDPTEALGHG